MWRYVKFIQIWQNFTFLHIYCVEKSEIPLQFQISPHDRCEEICFVAIYAIFRVICFVAIYAFLPEKLRQKLYMWRKNYKSEVCTLLTYKQIFPLPSTLSTFNSNLQERGETTKSFEYAGSLFNRHTQTEPPPTSIRIWTCHHHFRPHYIHLFGSPRVNSQRLHQSEYLKIRWFTFHFQGFLKKL